MLESVSGIPLTLEHLIPQAKGGSDDEENLWLSCRLCNEAKGILTEIFDSSTNECVWPAPIRLNRRRFCVLRGAW